MDSPDHRRKAQRNRAFLTDLRAASTQYKDWTVTGAFYCAIHAVMAHFHDNVNQYNHDKGLPKRWRRGGEPLWGHPHRKKMVLENLRHLFRFYNKIGTLDRLGRYKHFDLDFVTDKELDEIEQTLDTDFLGL